MYHEYIFNLKPQVEEMHDLCLEVIQPVMLLALKP